ncbi:MAG: transglycosylase domain-containing protein [Lachnospiraceae bacterium]|nr:transglycosylase domain-containing protein [Lachnospiraceae bacterium]
MAKKRKKEVKTVQSSSENNTEEKRTKNKKTDTNENKRKSVDEKNSENKKPDEKSRKKKRKIILFSVLGGIFALMLIAGIVILAKYGDALSRARARSKEILESTSEDDFQIGDTSVFYYADGSVIQKLQGEKEVMYIEYEDIPKYAIDTLLAVEDRKFFKHKGYDLVSIIRAGVAYIRHGGEIKQGGSTITQQLARTIYLTNEKTVERKVTEILIAAGLEKKYSKEKIFEFYINNIYFACGYYGLESAAMGYFGVSAKELSLSKIAFLCGIPNSPTALNPRAHLDNTIERRNNVLQQMYTNGYITIEEYSSALDEIITVLPKTSEAVPKRNNYAGSYAYHCAVQAMMVKDGFVLKNEFKNRNEENKYNKKYKEEYEKVKGQFLKNGNVIYTSIENDKQQALQKSIDEKLEPYTETYGEGVYDMQGAGVCIDNSTGLVVAIVGGRTQEYNSNVLNRAYQSTRQPGSAIKPLNVYIPAFEKGYWPETIVYDGTIVGGPRNSTNVYSGVITLRYAVEVSKNTIAWKLFQELGIEKCMKYLLKLDFTNVNGADYVPEASLGGFTYGTTVVEMTSGFATIANDGEFRSPTCILKIEDSAGNTIVDNTADGKKEDRTVKKVQVYEKNACRIMTDLLQGVMQNGTASNKPLKNITCAGKTGTTNEQKDGWFVGYTGYYTTGIWVGCDMPKEVKGLMGNTLPLFIWNSYMEDIHTGLEDMKFAEYTDPRPENERYPKYFVDTDDDGIPDSFAKGMIDTDGDFIPDSFPQYWVDTDGDGIPDDYPAGMYDTDGDGIPDAYPYGWVDYDGDGIRDGFPLDWVDNNGDGVPDGLPGWIDNDGDGIIDGYPNGWVDNDGDGVPDGFPQGHE